MSPRALTDRPRPGRAVRRSTALVLGLAVAAGATACTGGDRTEAGPVQAVPSPPAATASSEPEAAPPVPPRVRVTRVSGRLKDADREVLADKVGKVVAAYFDDAFLGGDYPRSSFGEAFDTFSAGAARQADAHRDLLTNRVLGPTTGSVEVRRQTAYLSVLAPYDVAAGVAAQVHLRFVAEQEDGTGKRVDVKGRLMLSRDQSGGWKIFGYDLNQSARSVGEGS